MPSSAFSAASGAIVLCCLLAGATAAIAQPAQPSASRVIEEILVTSRRLEETQQSVPVAVTAYGPEELQRMAPRTLRDLDAMVPNVRIGMNTAGPSAGAIFVRGLGYADIEKTQSPAVGVVVDGVFQGTNTGQLIDMFDVSHLEVNRGPQGVLYGKNTTGGTIVVRRTRPEFNDWGGAVSAQVGSYSEREVKARLNVPLIDDQLALKIGGIVKERDGFYRNVTRGGRVGDIDYQAATLALRWEPTPQLSALLTYDRIRDRGDIPPQDPLYNGDTPFRNEANMDEFQRYDVDSVGLNLDMDLGFGVLSSVTAYVSADDVVRQDFDGSTRFATAVPLVQLHTLRDQAYEQFSQELRLSGDIRPDLHYTVGGFYWKTDLDFRQGTNQILQLPPEAFGLPFCIPEIGFLPNPDPAVGGALCQLGPIFAFQESGEEVESYAAFGALTWEVTEQIELSAGVRYLRDRKKFRTQFGNGAPPTTGPVDDLGRPILPPTERLGGVFPGFPIRDSDSWNDTIFKFTGRWQITDDHMVYASFSQGFRSGGFSIRGTDPARLTYEPEEVDAWEIGSKNDLFGGRMRLNLAAFYTELNNGQFSSVLTTPEQPGTNTLVRNSDKTVIRGLEVEAIIALTEEFSLLFAGGLQDAERKAFTENAINIPFNPDGTGCNPNANPDLFPDNCPDELFPAASVAFVPDWNFSATLVWDRPIMGHPFQASVTTRTQDDFIIGFVGPTPIVEKRYTLVDARLNYQWQLSRGDTLDFSLVGKNLFDKTYREQTLVLGGGGFQGWGPRRQISFQVQWTR
ncbi:MAG: TonB-dependent receptor [Gammaproteobacteria bacterium]|nr:TonB-dependent receptor [Gammaproteobacteria bacterium]